MHLKRNNLRKFWPVPRKGTKFLARPTYNKKNAIPLLIVLRDVLKFVKNKKELKRLINEKQIQVNHKQIRKVNYPVCLFDVVNFPKLKKNYKALLSSNKKMIFKPISEENSETKVFKVINKKILPSKIKQLNLMYGKNIISREAVNTGDSVVLNLKDNKIVKVIPIKKGESVFVIKGKHTGHRGKIDEIVHRGGKEIAKIISENKKINVWTKNIIAIE